MQAIAPKLGVGVESLHTWTRQALIDAELVPRKREVPPTSPPLICQFTDQMRAHGHRVESICEAAPSEWTP